MGVQIYPNADDPDGVCFADVIDAAGVKTRRLVLIPEGDGYAVAASIPYEQKEAAPMAVEWIERTPGEERGYYHGRAVATLRRSEPDSWRVLNLTVLRSAETFPTREAAVAYVEAQAPRWVGGPSGNDA